MMSRFSDSVQLIYRSLRRFVSLSFILAYMILVVRFYELLITSNYYNYPPGSFLYILYGLKFDLIIYLRISAILMIPFLFIAYFSQKAAKKFVVFFSVLFVLIDILLLKYFSTARVPLGADLFGYSMDEIQHTIKSSGETKLLPFVFITLFLVYMVRVFQKHVYYRLKPWLIAPIVLLMFTSLIPLKLLQPHPSTFNNEFSMFASMNKLNFFGESVVNHYINKSNLDYSASDFRFTAETAGENTFVYLDKEYPFLHRETTPDALGEYFELNDTVPNFVFIIVESLGRAYSGEGAYLGSFTPFLDSLTENSLYWENCLSTSGRTFQVLPSVLASVPFGEHGFAEMGNEMPDHISLMSLLKQQSGYYSSFTYGGEAEFDNMRAFLERQGIDKIIDRPEFGRDYSTLPAKSNDFTWGFGDREIFRRYLEELKATSGKPRIDVMLTLAMHDPFMVPNQEKYLEEFDRRIERLNLSDKTRIFNRSYEKEFSTILYFDESLRYFFAEMEKLPSFKNTIFVITGDHRMPEIPISTQLDRFHVPLVIYSPMLKKAQKFSSMVTHFDITPSFVALLHGKNLIYRPGAASWVGHGLDTNKEFRNKNSYPLMRNKNEILDYIDSTRFLANNLVYQVYENMDIEAISDESQELQSMLGDFIHRNIYACNNNKLIPDSLKRFSVFSKNQN